MIKIWDIWIRLFHWTLVAAVLFLLFSGETSIGFFQWHRQIGELVLALILFRLIWSLAGSSNASLLRLLVSPAKLFRHLLDLYKGQTEQHRGHNAAGGWAVIAMLLLIGFQAVSGLFIADEEELMEGAFYGSLGSAAATTLYKLHKLNAELIQIVVALHIAMILVYLLYARQNLIGPMISGKIRWHDTTSIPAERFQHWAVGVLIAGIVAIVVFGIVLQY